MQRGVTKKWSWILPIMLLATLFIGRGIVYSAEPVKLYVDPKNITNTALTPGSTLNVNVTASGVNDLWAYTVVVSFNTSVLTITSFEAYDPFTIPNPNMIDESGVYRLRPVADGVNKVWGGGYKDWDDVTADGDTTYVNATAPNLSEASRFSESPLSSSWNTIRKVRLTIIARNTENSDEQIRMILVTGGQVYNDSLITPTTTYAEYSSEWATNPATGKAWTWNDILELEAGVRSEQVGSWAGELRITQMYIDVYHWEGFLYVSQHMPFETAAGQGVTGTAKLVKINFSVDSIGVSLLQLVYKHGNLIDTSGVKAITVDQVVSGLFTNTKIHDIGITSFSADPVRVAASGDTITFSMIVSNKGDFDETFNASVRRPTGLIGEKPDNFLAVGDNITLTFTWVTTGVLKGEYTITAEVVSPTDYFGVDNTYTLKVRIGVKRDLGISTVNLSATTIGAGESVIISVTVKNLGDFKETFTVKTRYEDNEIGSQINPDLASGLGATLSFNWATADVAPGTYEISAEVIVPIDDDMSNNVMIDGAVTLTGTAGSNIFVILAATVVIIVVAVIVVRYILGRRKPTGVVETVTEEETDVYR